MNENLICEELWSSELRKAIQIRLNELRQNAKSIRLPEFIELIPKDLKELPLYGHPISWLLYGSIGIKSFAIGRLTKKEPEDDLSEKHMVPPILSKALLLSGPEYAFSQVAVVIIPSDYGLTDQEKDWLNNWLDERSYMHRIYIKENNSMDRLIDELFQTVFCPWQSVKLLKSIEINDEPALNLLSEEE